MARVKLSELTAKKLLHNYLEIPYAGTDSPNSLDPSKKYVVKVDEGIKKRMKQGLVAVNVSVDEISPFVQQLHNKGYTNIIIEEFVPHENSQEKYLAIERVREGFKIFYSDTGGIEIEESGNIHEEIVHAENETEETAKIEQVLGVPQLFISQIMGVMNTYHFSFLEINPLVVQDQNVYILDLAVEVDTAGSFFVDNAWGPQDYRYGHIKDKTEEENNIEDLVSKSQASFKFVPLNMNGSIFLLLSGGGASIVIADEVANLGKGDTLANYGEYSGNPNEEETYIYTKNLLSYMQKSTSEKKVLIIAGGVANFTDVKKTFLGVIRAIEEISDSMKQSEVKVYVRRGGPNQVEGLALMKEFLEKKGLYGQVSGPDIVLTEIVREAIKHVE